MRNKLLFMTVLLVLAVLLTACGGEASGTTGQVTLSGNNTSWKIYCDGEYAAHVFVSAGASTYGRINPAGDTSDVAQVDEKTTSSSITIGERSFPIEFVSGGGIGEATTVALTIPDGCELK